MLTPLPLPGLFSYTPRRLSDTRGFFVESFRAKDFETLCGNTDWVQDNTSFSKNRFTVRGLHLQAPPADQVKLIRCTQGAILDVAVDVRPESRTFGQGHSIVLSRDNGVQLFIPKGFAHGFATLEANTEVSYKVSSYYNPALEIAIQYDDPIIAIAWPFQRSEATLSARDAAAPTLSDQIGRLAGHWAIETP